MNTVNEEQKNAAIKWFAIIGFVVAVIIGVWLVVKVVSYLPTAFSSLASIIESMNGKDSFSVETEKDIVNSKDPVRITFTSVREDGSYLFSYECTDGVTAEVRKNSAWVKVSCDTPIELMPGNIVDGREVVDVTFFTEKQRFTDVTYTIGFIPTDAEVTTMEKTGVVTIVNAGIPQSQTSTNTPDDEVVVPKPTTPTNTGTKPTTGTPTTGVIKTVPVVTTSFPESNPNGFVDLEVVYLGVGELSGSRFTPKTTLDADERGAVQFQVKNIGTKTSTDWKFEADIPTTGDDSYTSKSQKELRPGERAIITLGFTELEEGTEHIKVEVTGGNDSKKNNNSFSRSIRIND